ncbi:hypothetical protein RFM98_03990 [Mesorhizobium sp. VK9D]|nr:hypothetical protein [Mesorhizobium sp. VK9D]MDX8451909.1 hypothetical protein [Mesorhizobium sp. VK9D]
MKTVIQPLTDSELRQLKRAYDEGMASGEGQSVDRAIFLRNLKAERIAQQ